MRDILHCDCNSFYASVECVKNPALKNIPMAVCGDPKLRHGIILAKNDLAKKYGIVTAETIYSAKKKCRDLILVEASHEDYEKYSRLVNNIYLKYTDKVEPFGIDESFLDVTESTKLFGSSITIANLIKQEVKETLGITISVGVSFNKSLAKLGSDMKKPDAITVLDYDSYKKKIYHLPVNMLIYVGKVATNTLNKKGIRTIGDLASYDKMKIIKMLGKLGETIHNYANGIDYDEVSLYNEIKTPKSVSKGLTFREDLIEIKHLEYYVKRLCDIISVSLRNQNLKCNTVSLSIKDSLFVTINRQKKVHQTNLFQEISEVAIQILKENYIKDKPIRAITVSASGLINLKDNEQLDIFSITETKEDNNKIEDVTKVLDNMRQRYGSDKVTFGSIVDK